MINTVSESITESVFNFQRKAGLVQISGSSDHISGVSLTTKHSSKLVEVIPENEDENQDNDLQGEVNRSLIQFLKKMNVFLKGSSQIDPRSQYEYLASLNEIEILNQKESQSNIKEKANWFTTDPSYWEKLQNVSFIFLNENKEKPTDNYLRLLNPTYNVETKAEVNEQVYLHFPAFAHGTFNKAYYGKINENQNSLITSFTPVTCKLPKTIHSQKLQYFLGRLKMYSICLEFAEKYNQCLQAKNILVKKIQFAKTFIANYRGTYFILEEFLQGQYRKYTNNAFYMNHFVEDYILAFSHFTYDYSGGQLMITDLQGTEGKLTDPAIHTNQEIFQ